VLNRQARVIDWSQEGDESMSDFDGDKCFSRKETGVGVSPMIPSRETVPALGELPLEPPKTPFTA
jgi:hypothetical protein